MAEVILYGIAENLVMNLGSAVFHEIGLMYGVGDELKKLENTLAVVRAVLVDAEEKQKSNHLVAAWVRNLNDVLYDADDLLDDFAFEELRRKTNVRGQVSDFFSSSNHVAFRFKMGHRIKGIRERLDDIANDISNYNFIPIVVVSDHVVPAKNTRRRETCSVVEKSHKIVGRYEDKRKIIDLLLMQQSPSTSTTYEENLSNIVGIVGMGGLGKTTLAQLVYNDPRVANYFKKKMWVCVSDDFDVKVLVKNVLKSATNKGVEDLELDQLQKRLGKTLGRKRYLLVLDDVWNEDMQKWGQFLTLLPPLGANGGSKILMTTRSTRVASAMGIDSPYVVKGLEEKESWELFESLAFRKGEKHKHPNLVAIGREIVKMCKGVPLVIRTLGRLLCHKSPHESHWLSIKNNKNLMLLGDGNILPVLRVSYDNLPIHLKQCFAYCALFPKDYKIKRRELVQLWMAQGYIQPSYENDQYCLEDVGDEYFEDLLTWSLFEEDEVDEVNNDNKIYKMHDLMHDLARSIANSDIIILTDDVKAIPERVHHVSLFGAANYKVPEELLMDKPIRTFFMQCDDGDNLLRNRYVPSLKCSRRMRVLKAGFVKQIPTSLSNLSQLRYLDLSNGSFESLPSVVTRLNHLQTLKLLSCAKLKEWPRNMGKLINLRHLEIDEWNKLRCMPVELGELTQLHTLPLFWVARNEGGWRKKRSMGGGLSELKFLNNLRGQLEIRFSVGTETADYYNELALLVGKQYLESLRLHWSVREEGTTGLEAAVLVVSVMENLQPHPNLKKLQVENYGGVRFPNWMMNGGLDLLLPNLVKIEMSDCKRCQVLPPFGRLPSLKYLHLQYLDSVEYMKELDYPSSSSSASAKPFFPSLKKLHISHMPRSSSNGWGKRAPEDQSPPSYPYLEHLYMSSITSELCSRLIICASSSLKSLSISNVDLISLPPLGLQYLYTLKTLTLFRCKDLASLPDSICWLTSLTTLQIISCHKLTSLPEEIRLLPNLHTLKISNCLYLSKSCQKENGEDWPKICHIPHILIEDLGRS